MIFPTRAKIHPGVRGSYGRFIRGYGGLTGVLKSKTGSARTEFPHFPRFFTALQEGSVLLRCRYIGPYTSTAQGTRSRPSALRFAYEYFLENNSLMTLSVGIIGDVVKSCISGRFWNILDDFGRFWNTFGILFWEHFRFFQNLIFT